MIHSLFLMNTENNVFLEKHWKTAVSKTICDYVQDALEKVSCPEDLAPVLCTSDYYLIPIYRHKLYFIAVVSKEIQPLFVIEFLHRIFDTFVEYFNVCTEKVIKENLVIVYELLEEMLDNGFPLATESNVLKELIKPPNVIRAVVNTMTGQSNVANSLPSGQLSNIPWRKSGVKYANNEAYFDVTEEVDAIIDKTGSTVFAEIQGSIDALIRLSGMPDLTMHFSNPKLLDDVSFHPCIRFRNWETNKVLSFVPPDGSFQLCSYHIGGYNSVKLPVYVKHTIQFLGSGGKFEITIGQCHTKGKVIEEVVVSAVLPKSVICLNLIASQGEYSFTSVDQKLVWTVGRISVGPPPTLKGTLSLQTGSSIPEEKPALLISFVIQQLSISGLSISRVDEKRESYKLFKGVKYITKAGKFQVRT